MTCFRYLKYCVKYRTKYRLYEFPLPNQSLNPRHLYIKFDEGAASSKQSRGLRCLVTLNEKGWLDKVRLFKQQMYKL